LNLENILSETTPLRQFAIATLFVLIAGTAPAALALAPKSAGPVAVLVPPWAARGEAARIVAAVNGTIVGATRGGNVAIALSDDADFVTRLYQSGALLVVDAAAITACLTIERNHPSPATRIPI
jgi:hypothetical protein